MLYRLLAGYIYVLYRLLAGTVRLVGGSNNTEGRVEILHSGRWGTVCDDQWDLHDADVVCRSLGMGGAISAPHNAAFGQGNGSIWLDEINCRGYENSLTQCSHGGWGRHDCGHNEDASVVCYQSSEYRILSIDIICYILPGVFSRGHRSLRADVPTLPLTPLKFWNLNFFSNLLLKGEG